MKCKDGALVKQYSQGKTLEKRNISQCHFVNYKFHNLRAWNRTGAFAITGQRLTTRTMAIPVICSSASLVGKLEFLGREQCGFLLMTCRPCVRLKGLKKTTVNTWMGTNRRDQEQEPPTQLMTRLGD